MTQERPKAVTMDGNPFTLLGPQLRPGSRAPEFTALDPTHQPVSLSTHTGKTRIILSVASLDTSVCDAQAREFSKRVEDVPNTMAYLISVDLPAAQKRWSDDAGIDNLVFASDHRDVSFGKAYGVLIKELRILSRAAFVVNPAGEVTYVEYVPEVGTQPNVDAIIRAAHESAVAHT